MPELKITNEDRQSALFKKLVRYCDEYIAEQRIMNDAPLGQLETERLRGRIRSIAILQARITAPEGAETVDDGTPTDETESAA